MTCKRVLTKVEKLVCAQINGLFGVSVRQEELYEGRTKIKAHVSMARSLSFMIMHDSYGVTYKRIARHAGMKPNSVIHAVMRARKLRFIDKEYKSAYEQTAKSL